MTFVGINGKKIDNVISWNFFILERKESTIFNHEKEIQDTHTCNSRQEQLADELGEACARLRARKIIKFFVYTHIHAHTYVESKEKKDKDLRRE